MPKTAVIFLVGALAIGGMPPFNGFVSEFLIYCGLIQGIDTDSIYQIMLMILVLAGLSVIGGLSLLAFTKSFGTIFLGQPRDPRQHEAHEVSRLMLIPQYIIIAVMMSVALVPGLYMSIVKVAMAGMSETLIVDPAAVDTYSATAANIGLFSLLVIGITVLTWLIRVQVMKKRPLAEGPTWGCGYVAPNSTMQYTARAFSKPVGKIFDFLLPEKKQYRELEPAEIFPSHRKYNAQYRDFFEFNFIDNITRFLLKGAGYFRFIQNGRTQSYLLYGIVFILVVFLLTAFNILQ
jgi:NADH:ubiquinone oxidoreductase subunit 5 (subunit L)/multisubunit Na+/H+ antiporter MnhA subunit